MFAMEKDKDKRFQTATQMIDLLQKVKENPMVIFRQRSNGTPAKKKKKKNTMMPIIMGVVLAFLLVFCVSGVVVIKDLLFGSDDTAANKVEDYVGLVYAEVEDEIDDIYVIKKVAVDSTADEEGRILRQIPAAGERKKSGEITLYIGEGPKQIALDDYGYKSRLAVETDLRNKGLKYDYMYQPSDIVASGHVISTLPQAGESVTVGTTVTLILSSGDDLSQSDVTEMPLLVGLTTAQAYDRMVSGGLRFGSATYVYSEEYKEGIVVAQYPTEGTSVAKDITKVSLTISKGKAPKTTSSVPQIDGKTYNEALSALSAEGLKVGTYKYVYSDEIDAGIIFGQSPAAGRTVAIGSSVNFTVSQGPAPYIPPETKAPVITEEPVPEKTEAVETSAPVQTQPIETSAATTEATKSPLSGRFN